MTTVGLRGYLAIAFMGTAGITGAYQPLMASPVPGPQSLPLAAEASAPSTVGLLHQILVRGCELTSGAGRQDSASARTRRSQCDTDHAEPAEAH